MPLAKTSKDAIARAGAERLRRVGPGVINISFPFLEPESGNNAVKLARNTRLLLLSQRMDRVILVQALSEWRGVSMS
jgi:hypothetical protein